MARWPAVLLVAALALVACTGDSDRGDESIDDTTTTIAPASEPLELSIDGEGFLLLLRRQLEHYFARSGTFTVDAMGKLTTLEGDRLEGWPAAADGTIDLNEPTTDLVVPDDGFTIDANGMITGDDGRRIGQITVALFGNPDGLEQLAGHVFRPTSSSGLSALATTGIDGRGSVVATSP